MSKKVFLTILTIIIAVFAIVIYILMNINDTVSMIDVSKQRPSDSVSVTDVALLKDGFVVIHSYENSEIGGVLGKSDYLIKGAYHRLIVSLDQKAMWGQHMVAVLYKDNGDGVFDIQKDKVVNGIEGIPVMMDFVVK